MELDAFCYLGIASQAIGYLFLIVAGIVIGFGIGHTVGGFFVAYRYRRLFGYSVAVVVIIAVCVLIGLAGSSATYPGDEEGEYRNGVAAKYAPPLPASRRNKAIGGMILITIIPSLFGARTALKEASYPPS